MKRHEKVVEAIENLEHLSVVVPNELLKEKASLEERLETPKEQVMQLDTFSQELMELSNYIKNRLHKKPKRSSGAKSPPKNLCVRFPDGTQIHEHRAVDSFLKALQYIGLDKIADIDAISDLGYPLVSLTANPSSRTLKKVGAYFIETNTSTERKASQLRKIAMLLSIDIQVEVLDPHLDK